MERMEMERLGRVGSWLESRLGELAAEHGVPGAVVAVAVEDEVAEAATGVLNVRTGVEVTTDSVFQIGSITKAWTATLAMQLVGEGRVELDAPVRRYLPTFRVADESASAQITVRHLLSHTAGFYGELEWAESTRDDRAVQQYVDEVMPTLPQLFPPGHMYAYTNAGFVVLARMVEVLRDMPWEEALRRYLVRPLDLTQVATRAEEAIMYRAAVGHWTTANAGMQPVDSWNPTSYANACVGGLVTSARDLLEFGRMHLRAGLARDGTPVLPEAAVQAMRQPQIDHPRLATHLTRNGLGWFVHDWPGGPVIEHSGAGVGQGGFLTMVPEQRLAIVVLANGGDYGAVHWHVCRQILGDLADVDVPHRLVPPASPDPMTNAWRYVGTYQDPVERAEVETDATGRLWLTWRRLDQPPPWVAKWIAKTWNDVEPNRYELLRLDGDLFTCIEPPGNRVEEIAFVGDDGHGKAAFLHYGSAVPRTRATSVHPPTPPVIPAGCGGG